MTDWLVTTGKPTAEELHHQEWVERDLRNAREYPLADRVARLEHLRAYRTGAAYYDWEGMQPSYRVGARRKMQWAIELVGAEPFERALDRLDA